MRGLGVPVIGIVTYPRNDGERFDLPAEYVDCVRRAGALPVLVPPGETRIDETLALIDGLMLAGGGDVDPSHYGGCQHPELDRVDPARDATELALLRRVLATGLPCLCICRGCQLLNVALGGTLLEHLDDHVSEPVAHRGPAGEETPHRVELEPTSHLAGVLKVPSTAPMSKHHQAVGRLGAGLVVAARAPDGVIEALELPEHPWLLAVQWHPELTAAEDPTQQRLFDAFVAAAARAASL